MNRQKTKIFLSYAHEDIYTDIYPDKSDSKMSWFTNQESLNSDQPATIFENIFSIAEVSVLN